MHQPRPYERNPRYTATGGTVVTGWAAAAADVPTASTVLALDGPAALDWEGAAGSLAAALRARGAEVALCDVRDLWSAAAVERLCVPDPDADPFFLPLAEFSMGDLFEGLLSSSARRPASCWSSVRERHWPSPICCGGPTCPGGTPRRRSPGENCRSAPTSAVPGAPVSCAASSTPTGRSATGTATP